jgi:hypothetical protein
MMNKIASDAYSQGAYEALIQMNVPGHIKQAAVMYLTKEAMLDPAVLANLEGLANQTPQSVTGTAAAPVAPSSLPTATTVPFKEKVQLSKLDRLKALGRYIPKGAGGRAALGAGVLGGLGLGAYGMGAFEDEGLSNAEIAAIAGGTGALGLGAAYAGGYLG